MGLFSFFKGELIDVIEWVEPHQELVVWKFPDQDKNIKYGAQLTVRESQSALFLNDGQLADIYYPGRHTLVTENMPVLTTLKSWAHGFDSPFKSDVYFISTKQFTNLKWGTPNPVILRDPQFKQVRVKAFGTYFIRIKDPGLFFKEFAGTAPSLYISDIEDQLRNLVSPKFSEALAEAQVSVMDMVANYTEIGDKIIPILQKDLDEFGIELTKFQITSTSLPAEVEEFYDKMTNMNMVDDMDKFAKFQAANSMEKAAENGGAGDGVGMGAGFAMGNMMMNQMNKSTESPKESKEDVMKTLKDLGELKEAGILTEEEFAAKKKELLGRL